MEAIFDSLSSISRGSLGLLVNSLAIGVLVAGIVIVLYRFVRPRDAATSYIVWWVVLSAVIILPAAACVYVGSGPEAARTGESVQVDISSRQSAARPKPAGSVKSTVEMAPLETSAKDRAIPREHASGPAASPINRGVNREPESVRTGTELFFGMVPLVIFSLWAIVVLVLLLRTARSFLKVQAVKKRSRPFRTDEYRLFEKVRGRSLRGRKTVVAETDEVDLPAAAGLGHPVILITSELRQKLSRDELEGILLHELMHLERYDDCGRFLQTVLRAVLFFHPAVYWISSQLDIEREIACDDRVVDLTGRADDYAECLSKMAEISVANRTSLIPGALEDRKQLFRRFKRLLKTDRQRCPGLSRCWLAGSVAALILTLILAIQIGPVMAIPGSNISYADLGAYLSNAAVSENPHPQPTRDAETRQQDALTVSRIAVAEESEPVEPTPLAESAELVSISTPIAPRPLVAAAGLGDGPLERIGRWADGVFSRNLRGTVVSHDDDGTITYRWSDGRDEIRARVFGEIEFADDDRSIKSMSDDGYLTIEERRGRQRKEIDIEVGTGGELVYTYYDNGKAEEFDNEAAEWLGGMLLDIIRRTGFGAEQRVERILDRDGVDGVLREVRTIESDHVSRIYLEKLLVSRRLSPEEWDQVMTVVATEVDSDYETAELLIAAAPQIEQDKDLLKGWVEAVEELESDYETRRVLSAVELDDQTPTAVVMAVMQIAERMESDYEKAELMIDVASLAEANAETSEAYIQGVESIESDYEKRRVLSAISVDKARSPETIKRVIGIAGGMSSDYEKAELLIEMAPMASADPELAGNYIDAISDLDSDYETKRVIEALGRREKLTTESIGRLLLLVDRMDSDYEKAEVLIGLARQCRDPELFLLLIDAARSIESGYESRRVLSAYKIDCTSGEAVAGRLLQAVEDMEGDYDKAEMMLDLVECVEASDTLCALFLDIADGITSDYDRERVLNEVIRDVELDDEKTIRLLHSVGDMSSDYNKAQILNKLVRKCRENNELKEAFVDVLETMESDYEADRLYSKLYRRDSRDGD